MFTYIHQTYFLVKTHFWTTGNILLVLFVRKILGNRIVCKILMKLFLYEPGHANWVLTQMQVSDQPIHMKTSSMKCKEPVDTNRGCSWAVQILLTSLSLFDCKM